MAHHEMNIISKTVKRIQSFIIQEWDNKYTMWYLQFPDVCGKHGPVLTHLRCIVAIKFNMTFVFFSLNGTFEQSLNSGCVLYVLFRIKYTVFFIFYVAPQLLGDLRL